MNTSHRECSAPSNYCIRATAVLAVAILWWIAPARADDGTKEADPKGVLELIQEAEEAYRAGNKDLAMQQLQKAIGRIQSENEGDVVRGLPVIDKFTKGEPKSTLGSWGMGEEAFQWLQIDCRYVSTESTGSTVDVRLTSAPQLVQQQKAMLELMKNPQYLDMMNKDPDTKVQPFEQGDWGGWKTIEPNRSQLIAMTDAWMLTLDVRSGTEQTLDTFIEALPWSDLSKRGSTMAGPKKEK